MNVFSLITPPFNLLYYLNYNLFKNKKVNNDCKKNVKIKAALKRFLEKRK
jgi:hypothetical protein